MFGLTILTFEIV